MSQNNDVIIKQAEGALKSAKPHICGIPLEALEWGFQQAGLEKFRAKQVWQSIYKKGVHSFEDLKSLSKEQREILSEKFEIQRPEVLREQKSEDGTIKWLIGFADGNKAEMVYIPEKERGTLCISSQVGCTLTCKFCHTGTQRLVRNLEAHEIVGEFLLARDRLNDWDKNQQSKNEAGGAKRRLATNGSAACAAPEGEALSANHITNIVMMGMGEPLYNFDNVKTALEIIMDKDGIGFSKRRITLSTSGVVPMIKKCGEEIGVNLAVSLHAVTDEVRNVIVPLNKKYPIKDLLDACRSYPSTGNWRRITFEYVMLKGVNDSDEDAKKLIKLVKDIPAKINLIPFNAWPGAPYECSSGNRMHTFAEILKKGGLDAPLRTPRGRDILAACGQLKSDSEKKRKSELQESARI